MRPLGKLCWAVVLCGCLQSPAPSFAASSSPNDNAESVGGLSEGAIASRRFMPINVDAAREPASLAQLYATGAGGKRTTNAAPPASLATALSEPTLVARRGFRNLCAILDNCVNDAGAHITSRSAQSYMPRIDGLQAEGVSVHRNGIRFTYSFR